MLFVVCYDIVDDKVRTRMSDTLLDFGTRIQDSVFECLLDGEAREKLLERIGLVKLEEKDRLRIYRVCGKCVEQVEIYGPGEVTKDPEFWIV